MLISPQLPDVAKPALNYVNSSDNEKQREDSCEYFKSYTMTDFKRYASFRLADLPAYKLVTAKKGLFRYVFIAIRSD